MKYLVVKKLYDLKEIGIKMDLEAFKEFRLDGVKLSPLKEDTYFKVFKNTEDGPKKYVVKLNLSHNDFSYLLNKLKQIIPDKDQLIFTLLKLGEEIEINEENYFCD